MNNIETLHTIYIVCMTAAIIMLVISIVLFFLFDIRHIIGRMLGFSEKKAIKEMEENNSFTSQLQQKYNVKMKDKVFTNSGSLKKNQSPAEKLGMSPPPSQSAYSDSYDTTPLGYSSEAATAVLYDQSEADTTQLDFSSESQTTVLNENQHNNNYVVSPIANMQFNIINQIMYVHTDEVI